MATPGEQQFITTYRASVDRLYGSVFAWTRGDRTLSEDIVQETYLRAAQNWPRKGYPNDPLAWLKTVARNLLVSHFRRTRPSSLDQLGKDPEVAPPDIEQAERVDATREAIAGMRSGELVAAFHLDGKPVREIAREQGLSERAVEGRLRRARNVLRVLLAPFGPKE